MPKSYLSHLYVIIFFLAKKLFENEQLVSAFDTTFLHRCLLL